METGEIEVLVEELEQRVERLRALYEQYFMGIEKLEPAIPRKDVDRRLWVLRREQIRNTGLRFKLNMTIQRYNTYQQYWQRILREIENGTYKRDLKRAAARFGEEALTAAGKKRLGRKLLQELEAAAAQQDDSFDVDVEYEDEPPEQGSYVSGSASGFGQIEGDEPPSMVTSAPGFGQVSTGLSEHPPAPEALRGYKRPARRLEPKGHYNDGLSSIPPPMDFQQAQSEATAPRAPAFSDSDRAPSPPPAAPEPAAPPRPALLSALSGPVRRAPAAPLKGVANTSSSPAARVPSAPVAASPKPQPVSSKPAAAMPPRQPEASSPRPPPPAPTQSAPAAPAPKAPPAAAPPQRPAAPPRAAMASRPDVTPPPTASVDGIPQGRVRQIYESYVQARRACRESTSGVTETALADMLRNSVQKLKSRHGGKNIDFDVVIKDGKAVLKPVIKG